MRTETVSFRNARDVELSARLDLPAGRKPAAYALFAHCFTCSKDLKAVSRLSRSLTEEGYAVLRFDFTGLGQSAGEFEDTDFTSNIDDIVAAATYLEERHSAPRALIGHSLGGAAVLHAAGDIDSVQAVCTIGAPYDPAHVRHLFEEHIDELREEGRAKVSIGGRPFMIRKEFLDDLEASDPERVIGELDRALLIMHSPIDNIVGIENAADIFTAARHPKSFVSLDTADHLLTDAEDARYVGDVLAAWARRYIDGSLDGDSEAEGHGRAAIVRIGRDHYRTDVEVNGHTLVSDEPESAGGTDEGPTPYDLLLASLGSCTAITLRMYADRKEWPLEEVVVRLSHAKKNASEIDEFVPEDVKRVDLFDVDLTLEGNLDDDQRDRLLEIAHRCPVHRTLEGHTVTRIQLSS